MASEEDNRRVDTVSMDPISVLQPRREVFDHINTRFCFQSCKRLGTNSIDHFVLSLFLFCHECPRVFSLLCVGHGSVTTQTPQCSVRHQEPHSRLSQNYCRNSPWLTLGVYQTPPTEQPRM